MTITIYGILKLGRLGVICVCTLSALTQPNQEPHVHDLPTLTQRGQSLASAGRLAEAEVPLEAAASLAPQDSHVLTLLAEVKSRLGETEEAVRLFHQVVTLQPRSSAAHLNLGIALADTPDSHGALAEVEVAIRLDPRSARAHLNRARLLGDLRRPFDARAEFLRASQLDPEDVEVDLFWGTFEKENHRPQAAIPLLEKALKKKPDNEHAAFVFGQALETVGRHKDAIAAWQHAVALDPKSTEAVYALSRALQTEDPAAAAQMLERFRHLRSEKEETDRALELGNQGYTAMQQKQWSTAISTFQRAISVCQHCVLEGALHQRLGLAEYHSGDLDAAERELRTSLTLNPEDRNTVNAMKWIGDQRKVKQTGH